MKLSTGPGQIQALGVPAVLKTVIRLRELLPCLGGIRGQATASQPEQQPGLLLTQRWRHTDQPLLQGCVTPLFKQCLRMLHKQPDQALPVLGLPKQIRGCLHLAGFHEQFCSLPLHRGALQPAGADIHTTGR